MQFERSGSWPIMRIITTWGRALAIEAVMHDWFAAWIAICLLNAAELQYSHAWLLMARTVLFGVVQCESPSKFNFWRKLNVAALYVHLCLLMPLHRTKDCYSWSDDINAIYDHIRVLVYSIWKISVLNEMNTIKHGTHDKTLTELI